MRQIVNDQQNKKIFTDESQVVLVENQRITFDDAMMIDEAESPN